MEKIRFKVTEGEIRLPTLYIGKTNTNSDNESFSVPTVLHQEDQVLIVCLLDVGQDVQFSSEPTGGVGMDELELTSSSVSFISSPNKIRLHEKYLYFCRVTARQFSVVNKQLVVTLSSPASEI